MTLDGEKWRPLLDVSTGVEIPGFPLDSRALHKLDRKYSMPYHAVY
jgi:hypothetical protein